MLPSHASIVAFIKGTVHGAGGSAPSVHLDTAYVGPQDQPKLPAAQDSSSTQVALSPPLNPILLPTWTPPSCALELMTAPMLPPIPRFKANTADLGLPVHGHRSVHRNGLVRFSTTPPGLGGDDNVDVLFDCRVLPIKYRMRRCSSITKCSRIGRCPEQRCS